MRRQGNDGGAGDDLLVQRFMARTVGVVREILAEQRAELMRRPPPRPGSRHVVSPEDREAAEQVDEVTRARARQILERATRGRDRR